MTIIQRFLLQTSVKRVCRRSFATEPSELMILGAHNWANLEPETYRRVVQTAVSQGINQLEVGENGEAALLDALPEKSNARIYQRVGYRTITPKTLSTTPQDDDSTKATHNNSPSNSFLPLDVHVEDLPSNPGDSPSKVVHNMGKEYLDLVLSNSPLKHQNIVPLLHNPEVQAMLLGDPSERQSRIRQRLTTAMLALETHCADGAIGTYGICSNGLGLPASHPLHVAAETILEASSDVTEELGRPLKLSAIQLPANVLETNGFQVATRLREQNNETIPDLELHCLRPLTCYPDAGTGTGHPFVIADYQLPASMEKTLTWTNEMTRPPEVYHIALQTAMAHFDAEALLQKKQDGEELTPEERETLDGCKLLQSLLHDVDQGLDNLRSFRAHESELYNKVIPLIHDTFESYDDDTARILQAFFAAYNMAVRFAIARNTRQLLSQGGDDGAAPVYPELPPETRLQEFGLNHVLQQNAFDRLVVGCTEVDHVLDDLAIVTKIMNEK